MNLRFLKTKLILFTGAAFGLGQLAAGQVPPAAPISAGKVLAISKSFAPQDLPKIQSVMPEEARATLKLYLEGKIEQWFARQDQGGVVFLLGSHTVDEARSVLNELPLVKAKLMDFDFVPLGPLTPLRALLPPAKSQL